MDPPLKPTRRVRVVRVRVGVRPLKPTRRVGSRAKAAQDVGVDLGCHGTRFARHARGWYAYGVRTVRGAQGQAALRPRSVQHAAGWYA